MADYSGNGCQQSCIQTGVGKRLTSIEVADRGERPLIMSSSTLPGDFFAEELLVATCILGNNKKISTTALLDTEATGYSFIDISMACRVCDKLQIESIKLSKPKAIQGFDSRQPPDITYAIYSTMTIQNHQETMTPMLITKLGQHPIILGKPWMKKHRVILDMRYDQLTFLPGHYIHAGAVPRAAKPRAPKPHPEKLHPKEPKTIQPTKILKRPMKKLLPYIPPNT